MQKHSTAKKKIDFVQKVSTYVKLVMNNWFYNYSPAIFYWQYTS